MLIQDANYVGALYSEQLFSKEHILVGSFIVYQDHKLEIRTRFYTHSMVIIVRKSNRKRSEFFSKISENMVLCLTDETNELPIQ